MIIKLGDKVRFLNENMEGIVTSMKGKNQIGVTIESDFEIPVLISEVVKIKFDEKAGNAKDETISKPFKVNSNNPIGVFLAFERIGEMDLDLHLNNNLCELLKVVIYQRDQGVFKLVKTLQLERDETILIGRNTLGNFENWLPYHFILLPIESVTIKPSKSINTDLSFQSKTFHNFYKHCSFLSKQAYVFRLDEPIEKLNFQALKEKDFSEKVEKKAIDLKSKPASIIDLHYDALKANGYGTSVDITSFQMDIFTQTLEAAFINHMKEIVYIHGIGNAYLKNKIRTYLSKHNEMVLNFEDADILQFGGGATLVRFL